MTEDRAAAAAGPAAAGSFHGFGEALYLNDPAGNGLESYRDRPRADWPVQNGRLAMFTRNLAVRQLRAAGGTTRKKPLAGAVWGHLHLRVTALAESRCFYERHLGVSVRQDSFPGALFLAAGGYHQHVGLNVWGRPTQPKPAAALGLVSATFQTPAQRGHRELAAPEGYTLRLAAAPEARLTD